MRNTFKNTFPEIKIPKDFHFINSPCAIERKRKEMIDDHERLLKYIPTCHKPVSDEEMENIIQKHITKHKAELEKIKPNKAAIKYMSDVTTTYMEPFDALANKNYAEFPTILKKATEYGLTWFNFGVLKEEHIRELAEAGYDVTLKYIEPSKHEPSSYGEPIQWYHQTGFQQPTDENYIYPVVEFRTEYSTPTHTSPTLSQKGLSYYSTIIKWGKK